MMMKRLLLIIMLCFSGLVAFAPIEKVLYINKPIPLQPYEKIWDAIRKVESNNNPEAFNKEENAIGIAQIRPVRLNDFNNRTGKDYALIDMYDVMKSKEVFMYFASQFEYSDSERIARKWNGRGKKTITYWNKVKIYM